MDSSNQEKEISWALPEYKHFEKGKDWFWALGIIVICGSITSIIYKNYYFAVLLILSGVLMAHFAKQPPEIVSYKLNEKGLLLKNRLYPYETLKCFWVQKPTPENNMESILFIDSQRHFMPIVSMPIEDFRTDEIRNKMLSKNVAEVEMKEHVSVAIMDYLGF